MCNYDYCRLLLFEVFRNMYEVTKSGNEWHAEMDSRGFGKKQDLFPSFFFMYILTASESNSYNCGIWICWNLWISIKYRHFHFQNNKDNTLHYIPLFIIDIMPLIVVFNAGRIPFYLYNAYTQTCYHLSSFVSLSLIVFMFNCVASIGQPLLVNGKKFDKNWLWHS